MKVVRLNESQLRRLIAEELNEIGARPRGKNDASLQKLVDHINGAKQALSELLQGSSSPQATDQAHTVLAGLNRVMAALRTMPELTGTNSRG